MKRNDIADRLKDVLRMAESCPEGELSEIDRDILLSELRDLYAGIKRSKANEQAAISADIPKAATISAYETEEAVMESAAADFTVNEADEPHKNVEVADNIPKTEDTSDDKPEEPVECVPGEGVRTVEPRYENAHRKAILSLYDEDVPAPSMPEEYPVNEDPDQQEHVFFDLLDEGQQAIVVDELFGGDVRECREAMEMLSRFDDLNGALVYIHENYKWNPDSRGARIIADLLVDKLS